ncbi:hypothetical protein D1007_20185 [Hordeum vulgare]|nr:hypothetical protein D1007_20185 [Hordeum vulgare]
MEDCAIEISLDNSGSLARDVLNTDVPSGSDGGNVVAAGSSHEVVDIDDDFGTPVPCVTRTRSATINRPPAEESQVFSNKRVGERDFKLRDSLDKLRPPRFKHIDEARKIRCLVLSQDFVTKYNE